MRGPRVFARDSTEITTTVAKNELVRDRMLHLIPDGPVLAKVNEEPERLERFRAILCGVVKADLDIAQAVRRIELELPPEESRYRENRRVFPRGWAERHVKTHISRFYNQAVLEWLLARGEHQCYVPHSSAERPDAVCSRTLAGREHAVELLYRGLIETFSKGRRVNGPAIPRHPHCSHVVTPLGSPHVKQQR